MVMLDINYSIIQYFKCSNMEYSKCSIINITNTIQYSIFNNQALFNFSIICVP